MLAINIKTEVRASMISDRNMEKATDKQYKFTKFGVWDKDIKRLIEPLSKLIHISEEELSSWIYCEGIILFQKVKSGLNHADHYKDSFGNTNVTTPLMLAAETIIAFDVMLTACLKKLIGSDNEVSKLMNDNVVRRFNVALSFYGYFYEVQAAIATDVTKRLDTNPAIPREEIFDLVVNQFNAYKNDNPVELANKIDDHLALMREFAEYMKKQSLAAVKPGLFAPKDNNGEQTSKNNKEVSGNALRTQ